LLEVRPSVRALRESDKRAANWARALGLGRLAGSPFRRKLVPVHRIALKKQTKRRKMRKSVGHFVKIQCSD